MTDSDAYRSGLRGRIRRPTSPAPVPAARPTAESQPAEAASDLTHVSGYQANADPVADAKTESASPSPAKVATATATAPSDSSAGSTVNSNQGQSNSDIVASTGSMAVTMLTLRITGFVRNLFIGATLGLAVTSAFNVANTLPNLITEIVLGAVLTSLVVPVLVCAEKGDPDHGAALIRRLLTVSMILLAVVAVLAVIGAPLLIRLSLSEVGKVNVPLAMSFAFLLLPQIIFYGIFALFMAVLNTKGISKSGAQAPVANNVMAIATFLLYLFLPGQLSPDLDGPLSDPHILLLGLGTTLSVVIQVAIMIPHFKCMGINLRPLWGIDDRIKQFANMDATIITYAAVSQAGYFITINIALTASKAAPTIYQQARLLLQVPYGITDVMLLTTIMPRLSCSAAGGNDGAVARDLSIGTCLIMIALVPIVVFSTALSHPIAVSLFAYLEFPREIAEVLGWTLPFSAFSSIPYVIVSLHLRAFCAREETWTPTFIILGITTVRVTLSFFAPRLALDDETVVMLFGAANGFGSIVGAVIGFLFLRRTLGHLDSKATIHTVPWVLGASLVGAAVARGTFALTDLVSFDFFGSFGVPLQTIVTGVAFLISTGLVLAQAPLEEICVLGGSLGRIPGLRRFAPQSHAADNAVVDREDMKRECGFAADALSTAPSNLIGEATGPVNEGLTASPLLLPMPTQGSRPTCYVLGEMVSGGRFRLCSEVVAYPGLRLWRVMDTGDPDSSDVALAFVDMIALPHYDTPPSVTAQKVAATTNELRDPAGTGMFRTHSVAKTRTEVLIIVDWTSSIGIEWFNQAAHPDALTSAAASLAETIADVHESGRCLGLANKPRQLRIGSDGHIYSAFPVVLPDSSQRSGYNALLSAIDELFYNVPNIPSDISAAIDHAKQIRPGDLDQQELPACIFAEDLRAAALGPDSSKFLATDPDIGARESADADGAAQSNTRHTKNRTRAFSTGAVVVGVVIIGALVVADIFGLVNRSSDTPINSESVQRGPIPVTTLSLADASEWQTDSDNPAAGPDNPDMVELTIDNDEESFWVTSTYLSQSGSRPEDLKPGVGIRVTLDALATIRELRVVAIPGAHIEVRDLCDASSTNLDDTAVLGSATTTSGTTTTEIDSRDAKWKNPVVWTPGLPVAAEAVADNNSDTDADTNADAESLNSDADNPFVGDRNLAEQSSDPLLPVAIGDIQVCDME